MLWNVNIDKHGHLALRRARERREEMTSEKRQEARDAANDYHHRVRVPKRAAEGKPLGNACSLSGGGKARQALKWPFLLMLAAMCKANEHAKAYDHLWAVAGPPPFDPNHPARCGSCCANMARAATQLTAAFAEDLFFLLLTAKGLL